MRPALLIGAIALTALAAGCGGSDKSSSANTTATGPVAKTIAVSETDFALAPASITLDEPGTYVFHATNDGNVTHALELEGHGVEAKTGSLAPGEAADLRVRITAGGDYELYCPVGSHRAQGMEAKVVLGGSGSGDGTMTETTTGGAGLGY
jgi:uncharacterized cupredoxin-like copper-binding protein